MGTKEHEGVIVTSTMRQHRFPARVMYLLALTGVIALGVIPVSGAIQSRAAGAVGAGPTSPTGTFANGTVLPNGRLVTPAGRVVDLGDFPLGVAVSPDGRLAVAINSGQGQGTNSGFDSYCTGRGQPNPCPYTNPPGPSQLKATAGISGTHTPDESLSVVDLRTGRASEVKAVPTSYDPLHPQINFFYVGVTFSPDGRHLYASGGGNDAIYDFPVRDDVVSPAPARTVILPKTTTPSGSGFTKGLTVTPDGRYLLVAHELNGTLDIVNTRTYAVSQVPLGIGSTTYPYGVAVSPDGTMAYVSLQGVGAVARVALVGGNGVLAGTIPVGDHPTAVAVSPDGSQLYVANADDDTLDIVDTSTDLVARTLTLHAVPGEQLGSTPNAIAVSPDGQRVYVALAGDDAIAVLGTQHGFDSGATGTGKPGAASPPAADFLVGGMIPTGWYPAGVALSPDGGRVYAVSAKGLGSRYPQNDPAFPYPPPPADQPHGISSSFYYDVNNMPGILQMEPAPAGAALTQGLATAQQDILFAHAAESDRSAHSPIPATPVTGTIPGPIKYVIEIVRENRTFDQQLGDIGQDEMRDTSQANADPAYTIFGRDTTPNTHALVGDIAPTSTMADPAYATSDNFFSDGEASIQGHYWTAAATVNDYVEKSWRQYYSARNHFYDPISTVSEPHNCSIFQAVQERALTDPTFSYRDYGELVGAANPSLPGAASLGAGAGPNPCAAVPAANFDATGSTNATLVEDNRPTATAFLTSIGLNADGSPRTGANPATNYLRNFSYLIFGGDHTAGLSSTVNSPRALLAENDAGIGMIVQALSRSTYWPNTAIFIMEDDSQDGGDHVDGHRNQLYVVSPYAKHTGTDGKPGYIGHLHYSQASALKTMELLLGLPYLSTYDQNATALYDLFQDKDGTPGHTLTTADLAPYTVQPAPRFIDETGAQVMARMGAAADPIVAESKTLDLSGIDRAGPKLEIIDWQLAHPDRPAPAQLLQELRTWNLRRHVSGSGDGDG